MFKVRRDEPDYAFLSDKESRCKNRYGQDIELTQEDSPLRGQSLRINGDPDIGDNPNRYKQHGFYFNADHCIGCHACESACSEKNDVPAHLAFRSVGFVEGGNYPNYQRINISMACNHCDDPVCLKGCPTRAYTKFAEYGAVLQDPDICFGCGYCTWVCPYNAPQLDPVKGQVSKCNMCVDRLEVGLKPACVAACLGNALDFGVIENIPEKRQQAEVTLPGFPTPDITHPNIRFQQQRTTPPEMTRTDSVPVKYHQDKQTGVYRPTVDEKLGRDKQGNWKKLLTSHESSHVIFTLSVQAVFGALLILVVLPWLGFEQLAVIQTGSAFLPLRLALLVICSYGLFKLNMHLGKPHRFYRGFNNLQWSPVSREIAGVSLFYGGLWAYVLCSFFNNTLMVFLAGFTAVFALLSGAVGLYYMYRLYRIKARPFWDHWQTGSSFAGSVLSLGAVLIGLCVALFEPSQVQLLLPGLVLILFTGLLMEATGLLAHARDMNKNGHEGRASFYLQTTQYGYPYVIRNSLLVLSLVLSIIIALAGMNGLSGWLLAGTLLVSTLGAAIIGRSLFYAVVIPTTMPGAFFWKNPGFVDHARETGLADMPQVGVVHERHHPFRLDELIQTIQEHSIKDMLAHLKTVLIFR